MSKKCYKCGKIKDDSEFYKNKAKKDGLDGQCKKCKNSYNGLRDFKIKEMWKNKNPRDYKEKKQCPSCGKVKSGSEFYINRFHKDGLSSLCKECCRKNYKKKQLYYNQKTKQWRDKNREHLRKMNREYVRKIRKDPRGKVDNSMGRNIWRSLKNKKSGRRWEKLAGYTLNDLMKHLENLFEPWMNWNNYGIYEEGKLKWHIDHIRPKSLFHYETAEDSEFKECWALENLQPMEAIKNMEKGKKYKI